MKNNLCCQVNPKKKCLFCKKMVCEEHEFCTDKCSASYNERVRVRVSYRKWKRMCELLQKGISPKIVLRLIHSQLDNARAFKSQRNSDWSLESLDLVCEDLGVK